MPTIIAFTPIAVLIYDYFLLVKYKNSNTLHYLHLIVIRSVAQDLQIQIKDHINANIIMTVILYIYILYMKLFVLE